MELFAKRVRALREQCNWTQADLAEAAGLHPVQVSRLETGDRHRLEAQTLMKLAEAFGTTTDYLLGRTNDSGLKHQEVTESEQKPAA